VAVEQYNPEGRNRTLIFSGITLALHRVQRVIGLLVVIQSVASRAAAA
jgi:hypothetical protein